MKSKNEQAVSRGRMSRWRGFVIVLFVVIATSPPVLSLELKTSDEGPYPVGTTNMRVVEEFSDFSDEKINAHLSGHIKANGERGFITDFLAHPQDALVINVDIPDDRTSYGNIAGTSLPVLMYVNYPTTENNGRDNYDFPFPEAADTAMMHMQGPGQKPVFADDSARYPMVLISHGRNVHGIWEIDHARRLASHGYIVVTVNYGDLRIHDPEKWTLDAFFRPLAGKAVLDFILSSDDFGGHIDPARIATSGHSLGGFTSLALAGGRYTHDPVSVYDSRVSAVMAASPWVGGRIGGKDYYLFEDQYSGMKYINVPVLGVFGSKDQDTPKATILAGLEQLSGPRYVIELVDQPHVYEPGSWQDLRNWELLFLSAYLKSDMQSLQKLKVTRSMQGGNKDIQHFDLQKIP